MLIYINVSYPDAPTLLISRTYAEKGTTAIRVMSSFALSGGFAMKQGRLSIRSVTFTGFAVSALLGFAGVTFSSAPAGAIVYCQYVDYPPSCVARAGVVLRPRPVARAAVRAGTVNSPNRGGPVNRIGVR